MNKKVEIAVEIAKKLNSRAQAMKLDVPILEGLNDVFSPSEKILFAVGDDYFLEQFITDGFLNSDESFDDRVNKNITGA